MPYKIEIITANGVKKAAQVWEEIIKTGNTARDLTTSPTADPHLLFPVVNGGQYVFEIEAYVQVESNVPGLKGGITMPSVSVSRWSNLLTVNNVIIGGNTGLTGTNTGVDFGALANVAPFVHLWWIHGSLQASASGNVSFDWSQSVSSAADTTVLAGSILKVKRINP